MYNILAFRFLFTFKDHINATFPKVRSELCNIHKLRFSFSRSIQIVIINSHNMVKNGNWAIWLIRTTVLSLSFETILYTPPPSQRRGRQLYWFWDQWSFLPLFSYQDLSICPSNYCLHILKYLQLPRYCMTGPYQF